MATSFLSHADADLVFVEHTMKVKKVLLGGETI